MKILYTNKIVGEHYTLYLNLHTDREWVLLPDGYIYETINAGEDILRQVGAVYEVSFIKESVGE